MIAETSWYLSHICNFFSCRYVTAAVWTVIFSVSISGCVSGWRWRCFLASPCVSVRVHCAGSAGLAWWPVPSQGVGLFFSSEQAARSFPFSCNDTDAYLTSEVIKLAENESYQQNKKITIKLRLLFFWEQVFWPYSELKGQCRVGWGQNRCEGNRRKVILPTAPWERDCVEKDLQVTEMTEKSWREMRNQSSRLLCQDADPALTHTQKGLMKNCQQHRALC